MISIDRLIEIVRQASELMVTDSFTVTQKGSLANIVTSSDVAVQTFLMEALSAEFPESGFICEEEDTYDIKHEYLWVIDPIDGTANYSRGIDQCAISVGLKDTEGILMSVVYLPRTAEIFYAERGKGAWRNHEPIHVSDRTFADAVMCTALPVYHKEYADVCSQIILETFKKCNDIRRFGAAAPELCYLAMGRCELYFEYLLSPWDFAGASLILTEAGGSICALDGKSLDFTRPSGVLAANSPENLQKLLDIVKNYI